jgi:hypothetical protein|tara:strand:- start:3256 stop:3972 length:717 start_codon:yes stop_codon:yes gene_type:complete
MFLNDLSSKTTQFSKVNTWLKKEFGIRIDERSSKEQLVNAKKMLVQHKRKLTENVQFNVGHTDKHYLKTVIMLEAVDLLLSNAGSIVASPVSIIAEQTDEMENAQILLAAQDMVDKLAGMAEDIAELQTKALMPLVDEIKYNVGQQQAQSFNETAKSQLQSALDAIVMVKDAMGDQVLALQGGQLPATDMEAPMPEFPADAPVDAPVDAPPVEDTEDMLGGGDEVAGPADSPLGREEK